MPATKTGGWDVSSRATATAQPEAWLQGCPVYAEQSTLRQLLLSPLLSYFRDCDRTPNMSTPH